MDDKEQELAESIDQYKMQLAMVMEQLESDSENSDLKQLQYDLIELVALTEDDLLNVKKQKLLARVDVMCGLKLEKTEETSTEEPSEDAVVDKFDGEENSSGSESDGEDRNRQTELQNKLRELEGTKCRVAFGQEWGHHTHHNALVLHAEPIDLESGTLKVRVVFCNPTHRNMLICPYYLDDKCRYCEEECRYSHGYVINVGDIHQYQEPDFSRLVEGSRVLAKYEDGLWYPASVQQLCDGQVSVKYDSYDGPHALDIEHVLPLDVNGAASSSDSESEGEEESGPVYLYKPKQTMERLGDWEQHTKGIGSKLMLKMGYRMGDGLGCRGQGRAEPVPIQLLPPGKSLDRIMELKELAQDGNKFDAEKKEKQKRKAVLKKAAQAYNKVDDDVFEFINRKLHKGKKGNLEELKSQVRNAKAGHKIKAISERDLIQKSDRGLSVQIFKTDEEIKKVESEIDRIRSAMTRNVNSSSFQSQANEKLKNLECYLSQLKASSKSMEIHRSRRAEHKKLTTF